jgi:hypothetical protein
MVRCKRIISGELGALVSTKQPELQHMGVPIEQCPLPVSGKGQGNGDPDTQFCWWELWVTDQQTIRVFCPYLAAHTDALVYCNRQ